jgi:hypothetical protein
MKILVVSYSYTGNNEALAKSIATEYSADHIILKESKPRSKSKIFLDVLLNRTPKVSPVINNIKSYDLVIFLGPVWIGHVATPLKSYFNLLNSTNSKYVFISISGGAEGGNPNLETELIKRLGNKPLLLIDFHISSLLKSELKPKREQTSSYKISNEDVKYLTDKVISSLNEIVLAEKSK